MGVTGEWWSRNEDRDCTCREREGGVEKKASMHALWKEARMHVSPASA